MLGGASSRSPRRVRGDRVPRFAPAKIEPLQRAYRQSDKSRQSFAFRSLDDGAGARSRIAAARSSCSTCGHVVPALPPRMPDLDRLQRALGDSGLVVIPVSDETPEQIAKLPGYSAMAVMKCRVDTTAAGSRSLRGPRVARPVTAPIGRDGVLRETLLGSQTMATTLERKVAPLLRAGRRETQLRPAAKSSAESQARTAR